MKLYMSILAALIIIVPVHAESIYKAESVYKKELEAFKSSKEYAPIFDEDAPLNLKLIHRDIETYKELSYLQRLARFGVMGFDIVVVTETAMPKLYGYVKQLCQEQSITIPTVLITRETSIFNAFAFKFLGSSGAIVICQKLLNQTSEQELEAVIAHELGHIKYNHGNKTLGLLLASYLGLKTLTNNLASQYKDYTLTQFIMASYLSRIIIGKRFEKEADEFAYKATHDNGEGLIELFEHFKHKEEYYDNYFDITSKALENNKSKLSYLDYLSLMCGFYISKGSHFVSQWINNNTPLGTHPEPQERLKTIHKYRAQKS